MRHAFIYYFMRSFIPYFYRSRARSLSLPLSLSLSIYFRCCFAVVALPESDNGDRCFGSGMPISNKKSWYSMICCEWFVSSLLFVAVADVVFFRMSWLKGRFWHWCSFEWLNGIWLITCRPLFACSLIGSLIIGFINSKSGGWLMLYRPAPSYTLPSPYTISAFFSSVRVAFEWIDVDFRMLSIFNGQAIDVVHLCTQQFALHCPCSQVSNVSKQMGWQ